MGATVHSPLQELVPTEKLHSRTGTLTLPSRYLQDEETQVV